MIVEEYDAAKINVNTDGEHVVNVYNHKTGGAGSFIRIVCAQAAGVASLRDVQRRFETRAH